MAVLSHSYWERRFASDPGVVGRSVLLQGKPCTIVGVAPAGFHGAMSGIRMDAFVPLEPYLDVTKDNRASRTPNGANDVFARLKPGVGLKQASDRIRSLSRALARQRADRDGSWEAFVLPITANRHGMQSVLRVPMLVLAFAAAFLFLVACSNVASLLLARGAERQGEFAIRMALGGSRGRLLLQVLLEGLPLGVAGGLLGVLAAWASQRLLLGFLPVTHYPVLLEPRLDGGALLFGALLSLLTALLVSLLPALFSSNVQLGPAMKEGGPKSSLGVGHRRMMSTLLVGELALATLLLAVTGHVVRTMIALRGSPTGFELRDQLVVGLDLGASDLPPAQRPRFVGDLLLRARELPGVESAAVGFRVPLDFGGFWSSEVEPEGHTFEKGESPKADWNVVSPGYFQTLGIPLLSGREFDERDVSGSETVAIVDDRFVKRFWPGEGGVGRRVRIGDGSTAVVVGVVRAITYEPFGSDRGFTLYQPFAQVPMSGAALHVRGKGSPSALVQPLRAVLSELAPTLPMGYVRDLASFQRGARFPLVILAQVLGFLGGVTLFLAAVGIYGLFAHSTARRSREFGIRLSMGATPGEPLPARPRPGGPARPPRARPRPSRSGGAGTAAQDRSRGDRPRGSLGSRRRHPGARLGHLRRAVRPGPSRRAPRAVEGPAGGVSLPSRPREQEEDPCRGAGSSPSRSACWRWRPGRARLRTSSASSRSEGTPRQSESAATWSSKSPERY